MITYATILLFVITILLSFLQIKLSAKETKIIGFILPIIFLFGGTLATFYFNKEFSTLLKVSNSILLSIFCIFNIPTIVFFIIYIRTKYQIMKNEKEKQYKIIDLDKQYKKNKKKK